MSLVWDHREYPYAHLAHQFFAGIIFGLVAGYAEHYGYHKISHFLFSILVIATILDQIGLINT